MKPSIARTVSDAYVRRNHPRLDFRTEEGRQYAMRLSPYLAPIMHPGIRALDLGCSTGKSTFLLNELGAEVTGIDISFLSLRFAQNIATSIKTKVRYIAADYSRLPFQNSAFELVLFPNNVVECSMDEFDSIINETHRVLIKEGNFVLTVNNKWCDSNSDLKPIKNDGKIMIEGQGEYSYPTYTWSVKAVCEMACSRFNLENEISIIEQNSVLIQFSKR
jgi:ubiquinone/menaquinone biosynthesis C-methylase UbiE